MNSLVTYMLNSAPGPQMEYYIPLAIISLSLIVGSIVFGQIYKKKKKTDFAFKKQFINVSKIAFTLGLALGLLTLIRSENIPYFAMRLWLYLTLAATLAAIIWYAKKYKVDYPKAKATSKKVGISKTTTKVYSASKKKK